MDDEGKRDRDAEEREAEHDRGPAVSDREVARLVRASLLDELVRLRVERGARKIGLSRSGRDRSRHGG